MSLRVCIAGLQKAQREGDNGGPPLDDALVSRAETLFDNLERDYRRQMGDQPAAAMATEEALKQLEAEAFQRRRQTVLQIAKQQDILRGIQANVERGVRSDEAVRAVLDAQERAGGMANVEATRGAIRARAFGNMAELVNNMRRDLKGHVGDPAMLDDVVREAFGKHTGSAAAKLLADSWAETAEWLRLKFNAAGGAIPKLEGWGLPQSHDTLKVRQSTWPEWRDFILPKLDTAGMVDEQTGRPFSSESLELALQGVYQTIRTDGFDKVTPGQLGQAKLANRRVDHRFLKFASADDWLAYQRRYGSGDDAWATMTGHVDGMARDIAAMDVLGPNPTATLKWLADLTQKDAALHGTAQDQARARSAANTNALVWRAYSGDLAVPDNVALARTFATLRGWQGAAKLGSASLTALTDIGGGLVTRLFNGLPISNLLGDYVRGLRTGTAADRLEALGSAMIVEDMLGHSHRIYQAGEQSNAPAMVQLIANGVHRISGLEAIDRSGEQALGLDFMRQLAATADKPMAELDKGLAAVLQHYGIGADGWDTIRSTPAYEHGGVKFLRPDDVAGRADIAPGTADALTTRLLAMIQTETRYVVPKPSLTTRAQMTVGTNPGSWGGEFLRSSMQFKSFIFSIMRQHGGRMLNGREGGLSRSAYAANYVVATTLLGAAVVQLHAIVKGQDPRDMTDHRLWQAAAMQGGGLGVAGDFLFTDRSRAGTVADWAAGPLVTSFADPLYDLTIGNAHQAEGGKRTNFGREAVKFVQANTPGSTLWYARLAFQREIVDQLQEQVDPEYRQAFRRTEERARRDYGQQFYWAPGERAPDRAPDLAAAGGSQ